MGRYNTLIVLVAFAALLLLLPLDLNAYPIWIHEALHTAGFAVITVIVLWIFRNSSKQSGVLFWLFVACFAAEAVQMLTPHRAFEVGDIVANSVGVVVGYVLSFFFLMLSFKYNK